MIQIFVNCLVYCLVVKLVGAANSCAVTAPDQNSSTILATGALNFSINLYNALKKGTTNMFYSPFSVRVCLAMTAAGAGGTTLVQMDQALQLNGFSRETQIDQAFQGYLGSFCPNNNYTLSTANRIYLQNGFSVNPSFIQTLSSYYLSSTENVNFAADPSGTINTWVEQQTNNTIKDLFSADSFSGATVLVLVNAIYFKGSWQTKFDAAKTINGTFNLATGAPVKVPIMHQTNSFKYYESSALQSKVLQLNYAGNRLAMHIILPNEGVSLTTVQGNLNSKNINEYIDGFFTRKVEVSLPKFNANYRKELSSALMILGMKDVFDSNASNLTGIAPSTTVGNLYVSSVVHQAYVTVDEEGTVAAAATGTSIEANAIEEPIIFNVDRPCIYFICDLPFNQILFMGNLDNPSKSS